MFGDVFANAVKDIYLMGGNHQGEYTYIKIMSMYVKECVQHLSLYVYTYSYTYLLYTYI